MNIPKERAKRYEDQIQSLHTELESSSRELGRVNGNLDAARREHKIITDEIYAKKRELEIAKGNLSETLDLISREKGEYLRIVSENNSYPDTVKRRIKILEGIKTGLEKEVSDLEEKRQKRDSMRKEIECIEQEMTILKEKISESKKELESLASKRRDALAEISTKRSEVEDLIRKNGKILSDSEANIHRIEIYARRLQRWYDRLGVKFDVLKSFNVKPDEKNP